MRKTFISTLTCVVLIISIFPSSALAAWWNPFSWNIFQGAKVEVKTAASSPIAVATTTANAATSTSITIQKPAISKKVPEAAPTVAVSAKAAISETDRAQIDRSVRSFLEAARSGNGSLTNAFVSTQSKAYFDKLLDLARTSKKMDLLKHDFMTTAAVVMIRFSAASSTLDAKGGEAISQAVKAGAFAPLNGMDINALVLSYEPMPGGAIQVLAKDGPKLIMRTNVTKEGDIWKIDYVSILTGKNEEIEKSIQKAMKETGKSRVEVQEALLSLMVGRSRTEFEYFTWVPLNERGDLKAANVILQSYTDSANGYSILFPMHWEQDHIDTTHFFIAPYMTDGLRLSIAITPNPAPATTNIDAYIESFAADLLKYKTDITGGIARKKIVFKDQPAYELIYSRLRTFDEGRTYIKQTERAYVFIYRSIAYFVEYKNAVADFEKGKDIADRILDTFRFETICTGFCISRQ